MRETFTYGSVGVTPPPTRNLTAITLRSIAAGELDRWAAILRLNE